MSFSPPFKVETWGPFSYVIDDLDRDLCECDGEPAARLIADALNRSAPAPADRLRVVSAAAVSRPEPVHGCCEFDTSDPFNPNT